MTNLELAMLSISPVMPYEIAVYVNKKFDISYNFCGTEVQDAFFQTMKRYKAKKYLNKDISVEFEQFGTNIKVKI
jgi:hypothetical protein